MEEIEITSASVDDASEILALQKTAYRSEAEIYNDWSIPPLHQTIIPMQITLSCLPAQRASGINISTTSWGTGSSGGNQEAAKWN